MSFEIHVPYFIKCYSKFHPLASWLNESLWPFEYNCVIMLKEIKGTEKALDHVTTVTPEVVIL